MQALTQDYSTLALELAIGLRPPREVLTRHEMTATELANLLQSSPEFRRQLKLARTEWDGANTLT